ncbi:MAG: mechanosensitive ion channel family protein [Gammaproteobacteria bacterium]|nr:mechanosensitive ion channel family protein [Gammaproteobacteria bacterium]
MRIVATIAGLLILSAPSALWSQEQETNEQTPESLAPEIAADFDERLVLVIAKRESAERIESQLVGKEGLQAQVVGARLDVALGDWLLTAIDLAAQVVAQLDSGKDVARYLEPLLEELKRVPLIGNEFMERLEANVVFPDDEMAPADVVVADQKLLKTVTDLDGIYASLLTYIDLVERIGFDEADMRQRLEQEFSDASANRSVFLSIALDEVAILKGSVAVMPTDSGLTQRLSAAQARVTVASKALQSSVALMTSLELETRQYRQQLLTATGEVTTDVLDVGLVASLVGGWSNAIVEYTKTEGPRIVFRGLIIALVLIAFGYLSKFVKKAMVRAMQSPKVKLSKLLKDMIVAIARNIVLFIGLLFALSQLGISIGPLLTGLGIAGFIVGFALQDTLSNFASGLMILIYRPFDVGDFVDAGGITGKVDRMSLVNSTFKTLDNQVIVVPNNMIWQQVITNLTAQTTRRVDLTFGISYSDDVDKAKAILLDVVENHASCLKTPEPNIRVGALGESSVDIICRPWVRTVDYWETYWDLIETVKKRFDEEGITIPFPQRDMHMHQVQPA